MPAKNRIAYLLTISLTIVSVITFILVLNFTYLDELKHHKKGKCDVTDCNVYPRLCKKKYDSSQKILCLDVIIRLHLISTNYYNTAKNTYKIYNSAISNFNNNSLECSHVIEDWSIPLTCYYDNRDLPSSLEISGYDISDGAIVGITLSGIFLFIYVFVCIVHSMKFFIRNN